MEEKAMSLQIITTRKYIEDGIGDLK